MEIPSPLDNFPDDVKLSILTAPIGSGSSQISFVLKMMQINSEFANLASDGHLWQQLAKMEGFSTHHSQAYQAHYHYHQALALLDQNPTHQNLNLIAIIISSLNKGAALLHEGAVTQLINLMNSETIPLDTPFIHLPQWLDLEIYPLLSHHTISKYSPEQVAEQYLQSGYTFIKNNERAKNQLYKYVCSKDLNYMTVLYDILISRDSWKDVKTKKITIFLFNFLYNSEQIVLRICKNCRENERNRENETIVLDLMIDYLDHVKEYFKLITLSEGTQWLTCQEHEKIQNTYSKIFQKLALYQSSEYLDMIWDKDKFGISEDYSLNNARHKKKSIFRVFKAFESGKISPYWIDQLNDLSQYIPTIKTSEGQNKTHPITIYASLLQQKLFIDYPAVCFSEEILGTHVYSDQLDLDSPGYLGNDGYQGTILDLRRCLFWIDLAKQENGSFYHHQCQEFFKELDHNQLFFSGFSTHILKIFDLGIGGHQFYEKYLGSSDKGDFLEGLSIHNHQKLMHLIDTEDQEELAVIFEALSQFHAQWGEYETSLNDAQQAFNINPELYASTLFDAFIKLDRYDEAADLLKSEIVHQFCDPEEIEELTLILREKR